MRRLIDTVNAILAVGLVAYSVWAWPRLPTEIPAHFGLDGQADRWTPTSFVAWFLLPAMALVVVALISFLRRYMLRRPALMNLPGGKRIEDFEPSVRPAIFEHMRLVLAIVSAELLVIFTLIQIGSFRTAVGGDGESMILAVLAIALLSSPVLLVVFFVGFQRVTATSRS